MIYSWLSYGIILLIVSPPRKEKKKVGGGSLKISLPSSFGRVVMVGKVSFVWFARAQLDW